MTAPLSPSAQAVLDAFLKDAGEDATLRLFQGHLADALRTAAREIEPTMEERKTDPNRRGPGFFCGISCGCAQLLLLATELDPAP
jgi:hypothetical protein